MRCAVHAVAVVWIECNVRTACEGCEDFEAITQYLTGLKDRLASSIECVSMFLVPLTKMHASKFMPLVLKSSKGAKGAQGAAIPPARGRRGA